MHSHTHIAHLQCVIYLPNSNFKYVICKTERKLLRHTKHFNLLSHCIGISTVEFHKNTTRRAPKLFFLLRICRHSYRIACGVACFSDASTRHESKTTKPGTVAHRVTISTVLYRYKCRVTDPPHKQQSPTFAWLRSHLWWRIHKKSSRKRLSCDSVLFVAYTWGKWLWRFSRGMWKFVQLWPRPRAAPSTAECALLGKEERERERGEQSQLTETRLSSHMSLRIH